MKKLGLLAMLPMILTLILGFCQPAQAESPVVITPSQWFSGEMDLGTSRTTVFNVRNEGTEPIVINHIGLKSGSSTSFSMTTTPSLPATLGSFEEMSVTISFSPASDGLHQASIEVEYNQPPQP